MFKCLSENEITKLIQIEPLGQCSRKIWCLYEWLFNKQLNIPNLKIGNFTPLIDEKIQYAIAGKKSSRHRIVNNLPETINFCPLIYKTEKLEKYIANNLSERKNTYLKSIRKDVLQRAQHFCYLKIQKHHLPLKVKTQLIVELYAGEKQLIKQELSC